MLRWLWFLAGLSGCGRIAFESLPDAFAAVPDSSAVSSPDATCRFGAFSSPAKLSGPVQSAADDWFPTPAEDELTLYFYQFASGTDADLVRATRASTNEEFSAPSRMDDVDMVTIDEKSPTITADGLDLLFTRAPPSSSLYEATRSAVSDPFSSPVLLTSITSPNGIEEPWISPDGLRVVYAMVTDASTLDLVESTRSTSGDTWGPPVVLASLNTSTNEGSPTESFDSLEIWFSSQRNGSYDVFHATRSATDQAFDIPQLVPELSSAGDDIGMRLSADGRTMYFNYNSFRAGGMNSDIWTATRSCL